VNKSNRQNAKLLLDRINRGDIDQYFSFSNDETKELALARSEDNFEKMATILIDNLSSGGQGFEPALNSAYDSEVEALADRIIDNYVTKIETKIGDSFKTSDLTRVRSIITEVNSFVPSFGFKLRKDKMLKQLKYAELKLSSPVEIKKTAKKLIRKRGKDPNDMKTSKIIQKWGRYGKRALVTWGKRGIMAVQFLDEPTVKIKKPKLIYTYTKKEHLGKTKKQILSKKGQMFSIKERVFVGSRKNKSEKEVHDDYIRIMGNIRPKSEIIKLIKRYG